MYQSQLNMLNDGGEGGRTGRWLTETHVDSQLTSDVTF